jgi:tripartite-type tricarboxylate transporter receptor subunit TctC
MDKFQTCAYDALTLREQGRLMHTLLRMASTCVVGVSLATLSGPASTQQKYPTRAMRIIVPTTPGGTNDIWARLVGTKISDNWGQPMVLENRVPGIVAYATAAKATADGYTLLAAGPGSAAQEALVPNLPFKTVRDFAGASVIGYSNVVVVVPPTIGVKTVKELIAYAQARPGKIFYATSVVGGADHFTVERFRAAAGIKAQHVAFKGQSEFLIEIAAGRAHFATAGLTGALPLIRDGKMVALMQQVPVLPGVPLAKDVLPEFQQMGRHSLLVPTGTPMAIRQQLSKEVARIVNLPDIRERLQAVGFHITPTTPEETDALLRSDAAAYAKAAKDIGLKPN